MWTFINKNQIKTLEILEFLIVFDCIVAWLFLCTVEILRLFAQFFPHIFSFNRARLTLVHTLF